MKRGQTTVFIIIGIIILVSIGTLIYVNNILKERQLEEERESALLVPKQIEPIRNFIEECIDQVSKDGISLIGLQGGYSDLPEDQFASAAQNIFSNSLTLFKNLKVPYWYYEKASGIQESQKPSKKNIEEELNNYVNDNLAECVSGIKVFEDQGYELDIGDVSAKSNIKTDTIDIEIDYPIKVNLKDVGFNFNTFNKDLDVSLGRIYELAERIMNNEDQTNFLEEKTLDFMIIYDQIPYDFVDFECTPKVWTDKQVEADLKSILSLNIPNIKIKDTSNDIDSRKYFKWNVGRKFNSLNANLFYSENWPFLMEVIPNDNGILSGTSVSGNVKESFARFTSSFFCMNSYHFVYDIKYPVLVILRDENAFDGEGYTFQFATQVIIDNNQPRDNLLGEEIELKDDLNLCENKVIPVTVDTLQVNPDETLSPLEGVDVKFKCLATSCNIGRTSEDETGGSSLSEKFPSCLNGFVIGQKEGFNEGKVQVSTNQPSSVSVILEPIYNKEYAIKIIDPIRGIRNLFESEKVVVNFETEDYSTSAVSGSNEINLIDGVYDVSGYITRESTQGITLAGKTVTKCFEVPQRNVFGLFGATKEECLDITTPDTKLKDVIVGGAEFEWSPSRFALSQEDTKLIIYMYYNGFPSTSEAVFNIYNTIANNDEKAEFIKPQFRSR